jgi:prephenate dehydrogenase
MTGAPDGSPTGPAPPLSTVAVVGLGTIGGSLARDLAALGVRVLGYDANLDAVRAARAEGVVHRVMDPGLADAADADALVIAVPVAAAAEVLARVAARPGRLRLLTDVGSTKRRIVEIAERLGVGSRFVGAHPLAGDHRAGWAASRTGLFRGAPVYLCPSASTGPEASDAARWLWEAVGGRVEQLDAAEHDRRLAWTSHLPQALSTTLARTLAAAGIGAHDLGPGGREMTRLAGSSPDMWTGIALENADQMTAALTAFGAELDVLRDALARRDGETLHHWFAEGQGWCP